MTDRRFQHSRPSVALTPDRGEVIETPCQIALAKHQRLNQTRVEVGLPKMPWAFDVLIDQKRREDRNAALKVARKLCTDCPIQRDCLSANLDEQWARAVMGLDLRNEPTMRDKCGTTAGANAHKTANERNCEPCAEAERQRWHKRKGAAA